MKIRELLKQLKAHEKENGGLRWSKTRGAASIRLGAEVNRPGVAQLVLLRVGKSAQAREDRCGVEYLAMLLAIVSELRLEFCHDRQMSLAALGRADVAAWYCRKPRAPS